jgi:hypothetical protein
MPLSGKSLSNETDESDLHLEKHEGERISAYWVIVINVIGWRSDERPPMRATRGLAVREGKKPDDEIIISSPDASPAPVADPATAKILRPGATTEAPGILMRCIQN